MTNRPLVPLEIVGWTTPQAHDARGAGNPGRLERHGKEHGCANLNDQVILAGWATPTVRDLKDSSGQTLPTNSLLGRQVLLVSSPAEIQTDKSGTGEYRLNPSFSRWLMGYPLEWDVYADGETP